MKKIIFTFMVISIMSFSTPTTYQFKFKNTDLINFKVFEKRHGTRSLKGTVRNKTNKTITKIKYEVFYKEGNSYSIRVSQPTFYDISPKGKVNFQNWVFVVNELEGLDFIIKEKEVYFED